MIKSFLRGFFASFLLLSMTASASAQTKTWRHSLYQGIGLSNKLNDEDKQTVALRIGYAVSYTIAPRWAVTQGVALRLKGFGKDCYFAGNCSSTYIDLPLLLQYHFNKECIIRKTKRFSIPERAVQYLKTKRTAETPPIRL